jgi:rhodanese-related sulfurtransferase
LRFAGAFVPHIRDGTVVYTDGKSSLLREEWTDGKPQLVVDWHIIRITDDVVDEYIANLKQRGASICLMDTSAAACPAEVTSQAKWPEHFTGDYKRKTRTHCGLYCIYAAVRASGRKVPFTEFMRPEYLGSVTGSSIFDLKAAARDYGLYAEPVEKLTSADLKASSYCCILHVKPNFKSATYSHYVLFLGMEDDKAVLYDAPDLRRVALSDIAPLWGGDGLVIASKPIDVAHLVARGRVRFIAWSVAALGMIGLVRLVRCSHVLASRRLLRNGFCLSVVQVMALGVAALLGALAYHFTRDTGMLANKKATTLVQLAHSGDFLPRIGFRRAQSLLADGAVFVDARLRRDYEAGCLPGAMSIPVDANESQYESMTARIPRDAQIVVYCQSAHCGFAGEIAGRLARDNFQKVSIFRGGWYEWAANNKRKGPMSHDAVRREAGARQS